MLRLLSKKNFGRRISYWVFLYQNNFDALNMEQPAGSETAVINANSVDFTLLFIVIRGATRMIKSIIYRGESDCPLIILIPTVLILGRKWVILFLLNLPKGY